MAIIWDYDTGQKLFTLQGHSSAITCVAISKDGTKVLTGSNDQSVKLWDLYTGKNIATFTNNTDNIIAVAFSLDNS